MPVMTGLMISATKSEADSVTMSVSGMLRMNSPMMPGQKSMGANAATVVAVEATTGPPTSAVPRRAASNREYPISRYR